MTKLHILSDLHLEFDNFEMPDVDADVLVLAGDIGVGMKGIEAALKWAEIRPVVYVAGNHEFYRQNWPGLVDDMRNATKDSGVHFLERDSAFLNGVRFLGATMWTDFKLFGGSQDVHSRMAAGKRMNDYRLIVHRNRLMRPDDTQQEHLESQAWLKLSLRIPHDGPTVVVTHHAPSRKSIDPRFDGDSLNPAYASDLDYMFGPNINLWVSGHTHYSTSYEMNGTRMVTNCRGYPNDEQRPRGAFDPELVIEV